VFSKQPLPDACYRVSSRALIYDSRMRILILEREDGGYCLPGGGWEFKESFEKCVRREIKEELGVETEVIGGMLFAYRGRTKRDKPWHLRIAVPVLVKSKEFKLEPGIKNAFFVNQATFLNTIFAKDEEQIKEYVHRIWSTVEKKPANR
jgi:ADP-ribose pyrophosphatase YjhB (NUDIX family)